MLWRSAQLRGRGGLRWRWPGLRARAVGSMTAIVRRGAGPPELWGPSEAASLRGVDVDSALLSSFGGGGDEGVIRCCCE